MKGILTKLGNQWMVRYDTFQNDHSYPLPAYNFLPLHLEYQTILPLDLDLEGNEVEFEMVHYDGKTPILEGWSGYAKLLDEKVTCEYSGLPSVTSYTTAEYLELEGTMNLCTDIIEKKTGKMTEEEWQAAERTQTSKELKQQVNQAKEEFILDVNRLKYATTLMMSTGLSGSGLESIVRRVVASYENYIDSKIEFTEDYFKKD